MFFGKTKRLLRDTQAELAQAQSELSNTKQQLIDRAAQLTIAQTEFGKIKDENSAIISKYSHYIEKDKMIGELNAQIIQLKNDLQDLNDKYQVGLTTYAQLEKEINLYKDTLEIGSFGLYQPQFDYKTSDQYKLALEQNYDRQKALIKNDKAAHCSTEWTVSGSVAEGRKMTNQYKKLMLFAFNGECDGCIAKVKWNNAAKTKERIQKAFDNINKLGVSQYVTLTNDLLRLKFEELALTHEYELKIYSEKEEQRRIREMMREEEKAQREFERAQREAEDEEKRFEKALKKAKEELGSSQQKDVEELTQTIAKLEQKLNEAHERKERAISLAQQTKVGHIYIISNVGSFGENIYKIGLTRRLDPVDRVRELGDASVPFHFDVHAIIYSENAPQLEYELHQKFNSNRVNRINGRKEFFKVTLEEIEEVVKQHSNAEIKFTKIAEAREYRETLTLLDQLTKKIEKTESAFNFPKTLN